MEKTKGTPSKNDTTKRAVLHMAFELSQNKWKLGFSDGKKMRFISIAARVLERLHEEIEKAKSKFNLQYMGTSMILCFSQLKTQILPA
jgi:hypothetical protein